MSLARFAPTAIKWGPNRHRTCAFRLVGHGPGLRLENRVPGRCQSVSRDCGDGSRGTRRHRARTKLEDAFEGNAYDSDADRVPDTLAAAATLWSGSAFARATFGDEVVDHYANMARVEVDAFNASVTDWELFRGFERM